MQWHGVEKEKVEKTYNNLKLGNKTKLTSLEGQCTLKIMDLLNNNHTC